MPVPVLKYFRIQESTVPVFCTKFRIKEPLILVISKASKNQQIS
jgi:hypothetical protein